MVVAVAVALWIAAADTRTAGVAHAIAKILPKIYLSDLWERRDRRVANRSIHPTPDEAGSV